MPCLFKKCHNERCHLISNANRTKNSSALRHPKWIFNIRIGFQLVMKVAYPFFNLAIQWLVYTATLEHVGSHVAYVCSAA